MRMIEEEKKDCSICRQRQGFLEGILVKKKSEESTLSICNPVKPESYMKKKNSNFVKSQSTEWEEKMPVKHLIVD